MPVPRTYRVADVARMSGVSIRALHHYDAIGLLVPTGRTEAGYRLYNDADLLRLQQIPDSAGARSSARGDQARAGRSALRPATGARRAAPPSRGEGARARRDATCG